LVPGDTPDFFAITEVLTRLFDVPIRLSKEVAGVSFYVEDRSDIVLTVDQNYGVSVCNPVVLKRINALLRAARIHFVESYDWVHLPPEMRLNLIEQEALDSGLSTDDFKKMLSKWTN